MPNLRKGDKHSSNEMNHPEPRYKLNWRQILVHCIATCFVAFAFQQFAFLTNTDKYNAMQTLHDSDEVRFHYYIAEKNFTSGEVISYFFYAKSTWIIGLLNAFGISIMISKRKHWFWVNSLIVLILVFMLGRQDYWDWKYLRTFFLKPGLVFQSSTYYLLTNGIILFSLGLFTLFFKKFNDFIDGRSMTT